MVDEEVACLSPSTVYRILKGENLVCPWRRRNEADQGGRREGAASGRDLGDRSDVRADWRTNVLLGELPGRVLAADRASRAGAEHGWDDGERGGAGGDRTVPQGEEEARFRRAACRGCAATTGVATSRGSSAACWTNIGLGHQRIKPHCPEENGIIERSNRTLREALDGEELTDLLQARDVIARIIRVVQRRSDYIQRWATCGRSITTGATRPRCTNERRRKMAEARHRRREKNLKLRQPTLPLESLEGVANKRPKCLTVGETIHRVLFVAVAVAPIVALIARAITCLRSW